MLRARRGWGCLPVFWALIALSLGRADVLTGPQEEDAVERGLVEDEVYWYDIVNNHETHGEAIHKRKFQGNVLGYVTPWNGRGYDVAKKWRAKFTHISPVWFQLRAKADGSGFEITGGHDVDQSWISELRAPLPKGEAVPKVVPRLVLEVGLEHVVQLFKEVESVVAMVEEFYSEAGFDGIVFEGFGALAAMGMLRSVDFEMMGAKLVHDLSDAFHNASRRMEVILAVPPVSPRPGSEIYYPLKAWDGQRKQVDGFSFMTYDYNAGARPGPNAPTLWLEDNLKLLLEHDKAGKRAKKVFLGLNWYGYDYKMPQEGSEAILGSTCVEVLRRHRPKFRFDTDGMEHVFDYVRQGESHRVYYPTLYSIQIRLEQAQYFRTGIAIWELGQGLEYFIDLL